MSIRAFSITIPGVLKKMMLALLLVFFASAVMFALFYLFNDHAGLAKWYLSLGECFYKQDEWTTQFFTESVKSKGNLLSVLGCILSAAGTALAINNWRRTTTSIHTLGINTRRLPWYSAVVALAITAAMWVWNQMLPSNDEVFSVVKCTEMGPFRILAYYMLPNNHIYFNLINRSLFGWMGDFVQSGRLISVLAYVGVLLTVFWLLARVIGNNVLAFAALLPVAMQVHTWGFAAQARGYESQLLCGWLAFIALMAYEQMPEKRHLLINTLANIAGFILIPSYLYFYFAQVLFVLVGMVYRREVRVAYAGYQLALAAMVFLCYLPGLCFSGIASFTHNGWVTPGTGPAGEYLPRFIAMFMTFISDCFSGIGTSEGVLNYFIFLSPLALLLTKKKEHKQLVLFYFLLWATFTIYSFVIKRPPFHRTLIIHFSITVACCTYTFYTIATMVAGRIKSKHAGYLVYAILFVAPMLAYSGWLFSTNQGKLTWQLYGYDVNSTHNTQINGLKQIPAGASVTFSEDAFYYFYSARKLGYNTYRCPSNEANYLIKVRNNPFPAGIADNYEFMADAGDDYAIFKKK